MRAHPSMSRRVFLKEAVAGAAIAASVSGLSVIGASAAPARKVEYPIKGKVVNLLVPWPPGGPADASARILSPVMEKELGTTIEIVNRGGAGTQIGMTELARSKADGYTIGQVSLPTAAALYLNPERQAVFTRKSFQPIAMYIDDPGVIAVRADSPYKDLKSLIEAAKANPEKIKVAGSGVLAMTHLQLLLLQRESGAKFAIVQFEGGGPQMTNLLGGHVECASFVLSDAAVRHKSGQVRVVGVMAKERSPLVPDAKTAEEQGYKVYYGSSRGWAVPAGAPREIVEIINAAVRRAAENAEVKQRMENAGLALRYMSTEDYTKYWEDMEGLTRQLLEQEGVKVPKG
jgi:putative tricarboxylic transport membrane protein